MTGILNTLSVAEIMNAKAIDMAGKESPAMANIVAKLHDAKLETQGGPLRVMFAMASNYGEEVLNGFPVWNSDTGNNPAKFKMQSGDTSKSVDWYALFAQATTRGKYLMNRRRMLTEAKAGNLSNVSDDIKAFADDEAKVKQAITDNDNALTIMTGAYRNAMKVYQKLQDFNALPGMSAEPVMNADNTDVERTSKPILVRSVSDATKFRYFSVNTFIGLDVKAIGEAGGTMAALVNELAREGGRGQGAPGNKVPKVTDLDGFVAQFINSMDYIGKVLDDKKGAEYGALFKRLNAAGSDDLILAMFNAKNIGEVVARNDRIAARYAALEEGTADTESKAA